MAESVSAAKVFSSERPARLLAIVPHQDDFEFTMGGTFAAVREKHGDAARIKIVNTSTGASGHHEMDADATFATRMAEARESAALIGAEAECLTRLDGTHVAGQVLVDRNLLGGLWNTIRAFRADFVFCPPVSADPLSGVHVDHEETARAVRLVAFQLGIPRAYPVMMPGAEGHDYRWPSIILTDDNYNAEAGHDVARDISTTYAKKLTMAKCHRSQVFEFLPFLRGYTGGDEAAFEREFRKRHALMNERHGLDDAHPREFFRFSRWGRALTTEEAAWLFD